MKAIVTGGAGFIGKAILDELTQVQVVEIRAVINKTPLADRHQKLEKWSGGISTISAERLKQFQPEFIFHLARPTIPKWRMLGRVIAGFRGAYLNKSLIRRLEKHAPNCKLIYISGSLMYGESKHGEPHFENSPVRPISYARQYLESESPILKAIAKKNNKHIMIRVPWVLGDASWFQWIYVNHFRQEGTIPLFGNGQNIMQFITLESLAKTTVQIATDGDTQGIRNLFGEGQYTQLEFAQFMATKLKCELDNNTAYYEQAIQEAFKANIVLGSSFEVLSESEDTFKTRLHELTQRFLKDK